ncbi:MAG: hypothetical protein ACOC9T_01150 [Myxococcota bacterium]
MIIIDALLIGLAAYRLTSLLAEEEGPAQVFLRLRAWLLRRLPRMNRLIDETTIDACIWCVGLWITAAVWAVHQYVAVEPVVVFAAASVAVAVSQYVDR